MNNKKIISSILLLMILAPYASATQLINVSVPVVIDFTGDRAFNLIFPNGAQYNYYWDANQTHADVSFNYIYYSTVDEIAWCSQYTRLSEYQNTTIDLANTCGQIVNKLNQTEEYFYKYNDASKNLEIYKTMYETCNADASTYKNQSIVSLGQYTTCQYSLTSMGAYKTNFESCNTDLTKAKSDVVLWTIIGLVVGGVVYHFMKKKDNQSPSEQTETGSYSDGVNQEWNTDGPRQ